MVQVHPRWRKGGGQARAGIGDGIGDGIGTRDAPRA